jgi:hypothetical protein
MRAVQEWPSGVASIRRKRLPQNSLGIASLLVTYSAGAPLQRVQAQIRHKRCPYGLPHLFRFELELASVGALKSDCILLSIVARSFLAIKKQNGLETCRNVLKLSCADSLAIGQACRLLDGPERIAAVVMSLRSAYQSRITLRRAPGLSLSKVTLAQGRPLTSH